MSFQSILIFILFLGPLIFFHELGHFLFARLFGVRVETFSIGFGPKLLRFKRGDTEYVVSLIPLGGYVKMFGDDPLKRDEIDESDRQFSYNFKSKWARFWIVMGGPLANFIMAFVIFSLLSMVGEKIPEMRLGQIKSESRMYELGFKTGDALHKINGKNIYNPSDILGDESGVIKTITVRRDGEFLQFPVNIPGKEFFELVIQHPPILLAPLVYDANGNAFIVSASTEVNLKDSLEQLTESNLSKVYLYKVTSNLQETRDFKKFQTDQTPIEIMLYPDQSTLLTSLRTEGYYSSDLRVQGIREPDSPAYKAGVKVGDILLKLNSQGFLSFEELKANLQKTAEDEVSITVLRNGEEVTLKMRPQLEKIEGQVVKLIGVYSDAKYFPNNYIHTEPLGIFGAIKAGAVRSYDAVVKTLDGFIKLVTGQVSFKNIGGPVTIGKVAQDSFNVSLSYFFQIMAMISVNLGVINLFPIPVLDGGHILFLVFEAINGGPLSRRKMEIAQMVGLSVILLLMSGAIFNDFSRWF